MAAIDRRSVSHRTYLERTHQRLDERIASLLQRGLLSPPDEQMIRVLKKKKLAAKDQMQMLA